MTTSHSLLTAESEEELAHHMDWMPSIPVQDETKANILLVDDRADKRLAMETIIADLGENIIKASSGKEALRCLLNQDFAVILLDVNMPGMDGFETAYLIRQRKQSEHTPIIFITGISDTETHVSRGYALGAVDYILTPVMPEVLRTKVSVFVGSFKKTEQLKQQAKRLQQSRDELELRVKERTEQLAVANRGLQAEVLERQRVEEQIRKINGELEERVLERTCELALANQELEAFSYSIAHDLQAPLRNIQSYAQLLKDDFGSAIPAEAMDYFKRITACSRHMAQLVTDLLKLAHLGKLALNREEIKLEGLVVDLVGAIKLGTPNRKIQWKIGPLPAANCDSGLVRQVFANLISNAVKYSQPREQAVIEIGQNQVNGETIIHVRDNGVGFDMKFVGKLFGVFQRLHSSNEFEGTGVGLAIAARIVQKHGGRIWAEGEPGRGATFYFTLGQKSTRADNGLKGGQSSHG